ncbi:ABC transporter permease [Anaerocolumna xylanovorans]|uniref:NitT/TauT family transport system permease protein n=1 Tax=Anaerocolumna xylanovorans DSM 12503 TaxID=1121345 RepID=A0A1M7YJE5_9FIRM|nr:ABC transporter permease [Anaerocolumna xylanovorans]SHO52716.1 NitT/TauT family transport system permease protein [Anaerocolumna xylanovorans DSM 12503]
MTEKIKRHYRGRRKNKAGELLWGLLSFLLLWEILYLTVKNHTIPSPYLTFLYFPNVGNRLIWHLLASLARVGTAVGVSLLIGVPAGIALSASKGLRKLFSPFVYFIYPIPKVAFLPVFMLLFGLGNLSKILLVIWIIVFQIILAIRDGADQIPKIFYKVMAGYQATPLKNLRYLIIPAILPYIFSSLRISLGISLASLFFAENYATKYGIGYFILSAWTKMNYREMFCGILALGLLGIFLFVLLDIMEEVLVPWSKEETH